MITYSPVVLALKPYEHGKKMYKAEFHRDASLGSLECRKNKFTRFSWSVFPLQRLIQDQRWLHLWFDHILYGHEAFLMVLWFLGKSYGFMSK